MEMSWNRWCVVQMIILLTHSERNLKNNPDPSLLSWLFEVLSILPFHFRLSKLTTFLFSWNTDLTREHTRDERRFSSIYFRTEAPPCWWCLASQVDCCGSLLLLFISVFLFSLSLSLNIFFVYFSCCS